MTDGIKRCLPCSHINFEGVDTDGAVDYFREEIFQFQDVDIRKKPEKQKIIFIHSKDYLNDPKVYHAHEIAQKISTLFNVEVLETIFDPILEESWKNRINLIHSGMALKLLYLL